MAVIIFLVSTFDSFPKNEVNIFPINHIQDAYFRGCSRMEWKEGGQNLSRISYNNETCYSYTLPKGGPTIIQITYHTP